MPIINQMNKIWFGFGVRAMCAGKIYYQIAKRDTKIPMAPAIGVDAAAVAAARQTNTNLP